MVNDYRVYARSEWGPNGEYSFDIVGTEIGLILQSSALSRAGQCPTPSVAGHRLGVTCRAWHPVHIGLQFRVGTIGGSAR